MDLNHNYHCFRDSKTSCIINFEDKVDLESMIEKIRQIEGVEMAMNYMHAPGFN